MNKLLVCTHKENKQTKKPKKIPPKNPNKKQNQKNPQYSVWFRNHIQRNKFSCRVIIAVVPLIALHDWPQTASREGNKTFHGLGCRSAASLCLSQATELHRVWTWSCGSFHCGSVFLPWMGIILLVLVLLLDKPFSAFSCRSQGMLGSLLTSSWAWRINPEWTSLPGGPVWHSLQARYEPYSLGRDECSRISVFHPHRMIFFFCTCYHMKALKSTFLCLRGRKRNPVKNSVSCCQTWLHLGCSFPSGQNCQPLGFLGRDWSSVWWVQTTQGFSQGVLLPRKPTALGYTEHFYKKLLICVIFFHFSSFREY